MSSSNDRAPVLVLLAGLPGSGKTTLACLLAERLDAEHLESDAIRRGLVAQPTYDADEHSRVFAEVDRRTREALGHGRSVVLDATNLRAAHRRRYALMADGAGARLVRAWVTAPFETLLERVRAPRAGYSQAGEQVLRQLVLTAERFGEPAVMVDSRFGFGPTVDLIARLAGRS